MAGEAATASLVLQGVGHTINYGVGMLSNYVNYKQQKAQLKHQYNVAKANYKVMTDNANAALSALSYNEGVMSREHNRRLAEIETAFASSGVSAASVTAQEVYQAQVEANTEELWNMRRQTDNDVGALILDRNNMMTEAKYNYEWGKKANKYNAIFSAIGQTANFLGNISTMSPSGGSGGGGGGNYGLFQGAGQAWGGIQSVFSSGGEAAGAAAGGA